MEVQEALQKRRSVRKYTEEKVSNEDIEKLLHAAMSGPSAVNLKPWEFCVIENEETIEKLRGASKFTKIKAPLAIVVCGKIKALVPQPLSSFWVQDCSAATENILLCATDLGLGTVWCGIHPNEGPVKKVREILDLKKNEIPLNIIWVGHPAEEPEARDQYDPECIKRYLVKELAGYE